MAQSPTKQLEAADGCGEDDYGEWSLDLKSNAFEGAMSEVSTVFESERAAFEREFLTKFRELRRPITKEIIDTVNSGRAAVEVVNEFFDKAVVEVMGFMQGRRQLEDSLQGRLKHATHDVFDKGIDAMLRRDREKKAFLKQSFEARIEESRVSSKVELSNSALVLEAKFERKIFDLKERAKRDADALNAALRSKDEEMRLAQAQFNSKLAAEKAGSKHFADQLKTDLESAKAQLEFLRKSTASTSSAKSVLEAERKALSDEMNRLTTLHKEERQRNELQTHKLRTELDDVKAVQAAERKKIKETTEQASKQLEAAHDQLRSMQFELQSMQQRVDVSSVRLAESEGSLKDLYGRYRESQSILSETLSSKEEHEKAMLLAQDTIMELTREKDEVVVILQDSKEQLAAGELKLAEIQSELEAVLKAQERNRKKLLDSEMRVNMVTADFNAAKVRQQELENEVSALKEEIESLKSARDDALHKNSHNSSSASQQLEDLRTEFEDARAMRELDKLGSEEVIASLRSRIAVLESAQVPRAQQPESGQPAGAAVVAGASTTAARPAANAGAHLHVIPAVQSAAATTQAAASSVAAAHDAHDALSQQPHDVPVESMSILSTHELAESLANVDASQEPVLTDASRNASKTATRMKNKSPETSGTEFARLPSAASNQSNPVSQESHPPSAASSKPGTQVRSTDHPQMPSSSDTAPHSGVKDSEHARARSTSREGQRLKTASVVSTSSGFSVSGMSGSEAAFVFMNDAGTTLLIDSASEVCFVWIVLKFLPVSHCVYTDVHTLCICLDQRALTQRCRPHRSPLRIPPPPQIPRN
jgi:hypothetical protein